MKTVESFRIHKLKCWPEFYAALIAGDKRDELRLNDRNYKVGDVLILQEYDNNIDLYTGDESKWLVTWIVDGFGLKDGYVAMSVKPVGTFSRDCLSCDQSFVTYDTAHTHCSDCL